MVKYVLVCSLLVAFALGVSAQTSTPQRHQFVTKKVGEGSFNNPPTFDPSMKSMEMPHPNSGTTRAHLQEIKKDVRKQFPLGNSTNKHAGTHAFAAFGQGDSLIQGRNFEGNLAGNGVPNDNTLAISDGGQLISCINSTISGYDIPADTLMFTQSLASFSLDLNIVGGKFDPKAIYDPEEDRFILVFLSGNTPLNSNIIVAFSTTNQLDDPWNLFSLPGDPIQDSTWSDYPALTITDDELFITVNQIIPGVSWQVGFSQSIIWQLNKTAAFEGDTTLQSTLWTEINFNDQPIRNLNPVKGGSQPYGPNAYFISNRNFDLQNDTVFIVEITDNASSQDATAVVKYSRTDTPYGVPPEARQQGSHRFDTNDGRWLGAFLENDRIQFVGNTVNPATGLSAVYHGFIDSLEHTNPPVTGVILGDVGPDSMDFGYPNIVYIGEHGCDDESVIIFEHTSPTVYAGYSAVSYNNWHEYSKRTVVKEGDSFVNVLSGGYERWGDYTGLQRKYNEPGTVWAAATYGKVNRSNGTWITSLTMSDSVPPIATPQQQLTNASLNGSDGSISVTVTGGYEPLTYAWNDAQSSTTTQAVDLAHGTYTLTITDAKNCKVQIPIEVGTDLPETSLWPVPVGDRLYIRFELPKSQIVEGAIYDIRGRLIELLYSGEAQPGENLFSFDTLPLAKGVYVLKLTTEDGTLLNEKIVKE